MIIGFIEESQNQKSVLIIFIYNINIINIYSTTFVFQRSFLRNWDEI